MISNVLLCICLLISPLWPRMREVAGSIPSQAIPKTLKMVVIAALLGAQGCGLVLQLTCWCRDKWTSSTGNLPRKRCDLTVKIVESGVKHQSINQICLLFYLSHIHLLDLFAGAMSVCL